MGSKEFINNLPRWCLWLVEVSPSELRKMPSIIKRIEEVREYRLSSPKVATRKNAETPTLFQEIRQPKDSETFIAIPEVSSQNRRYVPMDFMTGEIIVSNKLQIVVNAEIYHFGVLQSNVHMSWVRAVCGRLKSDYDYSGKVVYNNFPWPTPTDAQKQAIEQTAQGILDARAKFPDASLADLYDETTMPPELRKAHQANDRAVMAAYGFDTKMSEAACVARLMERYRELTAKQNAGREAPRKS